MREQTREHGRVIEGRAQQIALILARALDARDHLERDVLGLIQPLDLLVVSRAQLSVE